MPYVFWIFDWIKVSWKNDSHFLSGDDLNQNDSSSNKDYDSKEIHEWSIVQLQGIRNSE